MQIKPERRPILSFEEGALRDGYVLTVDKARRMREILSGFMSGLLAGAVKVRIANVPGDCFARGEGHFHLVPEAFLQTCGSTRFIFPHEQIDIGPGEVLIVPPRLMHLEYVMQGPQSEPFSNVVIFADGTSLSCHLASETSAGKPGIHHLEARHHTHSPRIHDWLADAARLGNEANAASESGYTALVLTQIRSLVAISCAGVLRILDDGARSMQPEPALIARVRSWVQNQLGDHELSVPQLASQAGCTPDYLSHLFSRSTGEHITAHINRLRLERAARLLAETRMACKEVAWACGLSQSYFIQLFRARYGITPKKWQVKRKSDLGETTTEDSGGFFGLAG